MTGRRIRPIVLAALLLLCGALSPARGQTADRSADAMYADAVAQEKAVRAAFNAKLTAPAMVRAVRTVVDAYEELVRRHPRSGYCDDALWNAAMLSSEAFSRYGDPHERDTALRLLRMLSSEYPSSRLAAKVPQALASAERAVPSVAPARPPALATISGIERAALPDAVRIIIQLDAEVQFREERLTDPDRVFVDLFATTLAPSVEVGTLRFDGDTLPVRQVRIGRHPNDVTRVVLESADVATCSVYSVYAPYRLVVECIPATRPPAPADPFLAARAIDAAWERIQPGLPTAPPGEPEPVGTSSVATARGPAAAPPAAAAPAPAAAPPVQAGAPPAATAPSPPSANMAGGFSVARQLGLGVSRIVIDPGHGGHDPGAKGHGITEAAIVLDVALRLEKIFATVPGVDVILTRRSDVYVPLEERSAMANRENADLFLSIHANGSRNTKASGVETYYLNFAATEDAAAVAARENAGSAQAMANLPDVIRAITLNNKRDESRDFAAYVQRAIVRQLRPANRDVKDLGVKQAPFMVLVGAGMPSVLAEISFITHAQDARLLRTPAYRQRIAQALFEAIRDYQTSLKGSDAVALRRGGSGSAEGIAGPEP